MIALHDLLLAHGRGDAPVCRDGDAAFGFDAFVAQVGALAAALRTRPGTRVALCCDDAWRFACALYGLLAAGKEPVIPASAAPDYVAGLSDAYDAVLDGPALDALVAAGASTPPQAAALAIDARAPLTLFTSGSSGTPKAVRKTLDQFDAEVRTLEAQWGALLGRATVLAGVPHHHIYGMLFRVFWPLAAGRPFDRAICADPRQLQARIARYGATVVVSTPAQLSRWPDLPGFAALAPRPAAFFSSGGPLAAASAQRFVAAFGAAPLEIYGSTETGGIAWRSQARTDAWTPLPGIDVRAGEDGALDVRSPHLGHDRWHRTDDQAAFDGHGRFRLEGRLDRVLKVDGKRVSPGELESRLRLHPWIADVALAPLAAASRQRLGALVVLSADGDDALRRDGRVSLVKALRRHLAAWFDTVVLPRHWRFHRALPFDARGKLQAAAVARAFAPRAEGFELLAETATADTRGYELRVPRTLDHFAGHFPGLPILPGVVQIDWAVRLAAGFVPDVRALVSIDQLKFTAPVPPGAVLALELAHDAARRRVSFVWRLGARTCASGVIVYAEAA